MLETNSVPAFSTSNDYVDLEGQPATTSNSRNSLQSFFTLFRLRESEGMDGERKGRIPFLDLLINFAIVLAVGALSKMFFDIVGPFHRGFFCDDDSIRLPYKTGTVPVWMLALYCVGLPSVAFVFVEHQRLTDPRTVSEQINADEQGQSLRVRLFIRWLFFKGCTLIALVAALIFTSTAKVSVGRLRPHFISLCAPLIGGNQTEQSFCSLPENQHRYVEEFNCSSGASPEQITEARLSFFSGHSSLAMCAAAFTTIYLHSRLASLSRRFVFVPLLQIAVLTSAMFIAYSRIQDHMHHWSDVLIGMMCGSSVATLMAFGVVGFNLRSRKPFSFQRSSEESSTNGAT